MSSIVDTLSRTVAPVKNQVVQTAQSGEEPPSGVQGKGNSTEPYDGGNAVENGEVTKSSGGTSQAVADTTSTSPEDSKNATSTSSDERTGRSRLTAPASRKVEERDVSPGTLPDGSHAKTSGDRGEGYEPAKGLNKLKGKVFGKH